MAFVSCEGVHAYLIVKIKMVVFGVYVFDDEIKFPSCLQVHSALEFVVGGWANVSRPAQGNICENVR